MGEFDAVVRVAERWRDPEYGPRARAVNRTLASANRFTGEALAFAINQQMHQITRHGLGSWLAARKARHPCRVGVLNAGNVPLVGLQDLLAVVLTGHAYVGSRSSRSPELLPAFLACLRDEARLLSGRFVSPAALWEEADALIATGSDAIGSWVEEQARTHGMPADRLLLRGHSYAVAVIDGQETLDDRERLAEDILLHEGMGCRSVALVWAPAGLSPDPYLESLAAFRGVFPAHAATPGALSVQRAFLEALDRPHAYGEGLEFLVSRGDPEPQAPGHLRWTQYDDIAQVARFLHQEQDVIQLVVAPPTVSARLRIPMAIQPPGYAQRPALDWRPDGRDTVGFLCGLGRRSD